MLRLNIQACKQANLFGMRTLHPAVAVAELSSSSGTAAVEVGVAAAVAVAVGPKSALRDIRNREQGTAVPV